MDGIKEFRIDTDGLSQNEKIILDKLISAARLIAPLYLEQRNSKFPGANFYPHDASTKEVTEAAQKNPAILDPFTVLERSRSNGLVAIPYHLKYKKKLEPVANLLLEAAKLSKNRDFTRYLRSRAHSLLEGDYQKSEILWLKTETFKFGFVIGPIERYLDKLFFKKCAYQAWVGLIDEKRTQAAENLKRLILESRKRIIPEAAKVNVSNVGVRVDKTAIFSGLIADFMFTGTNLPNDVNLMEKYGSELTIFETSLALKFREQQFPIFKAIFEKDFQKSYGEKLLYDGSLNCILLHELAHSLIRYRDAEYRLGDLFPVIDELYAYILGIKSLGPLFLKGTLTQKELEAVLVMHICRNFAWWIDSLANPNTSHYAKGAAIALNFFFREGAIEEKNGISWPNFAKLFICIDELCHVLEYFLALGTYGETLKFIDKYGTFEVFERFYPSLKKSGCLPQ